MLQSDAAQNDVQNGAHFEQHCYCWDLLAAELLSTQCQGRCLQHTTCVSERHTFLAHVQANDLLLRSGMLLKRSTIYPDQHSVHMCTAALWSHTEPLYTGSEAQTSTVVCRRIAVSV